MLIDYTKTMEKVISKLKDLKLEVDLKERFSFDFKYDSNIFLTEEIQQLSASVNIFDKNIILKELISEKYSCCNSSQQTELNFWIINNWGGIQSFKKTHVNIEKIRRFNQQLISKSLTSDTFGVISSLSKLASFQYPENYVIYDSRVIYVLNWFILTLENNRGLKTPYFPIPSGRNRIVSDFDMNTIINLYHKDLYLNKSELFISPKTAYFEFCRFIKQASKEVFGPNSMPFQLEMLLFVLLEEEIFSEIKQILKIDLNY